MLGCLGIFLVLGWLALEVYSYLGVSWWLQIHARDIVGSGYLEALLLLAATSVAGFLLAKRHIAQLPAALMGAFMGRGGEAGSRFVGLVGAVLLAIPGFAGDIPGILLQIPLIQRLFASIGQRLAMGLAKQAMGKMMGGKMPPGFPGMGGMPGGFPGGFPGMPGFPGPGGKPLLRPDDAVRKGRGKTYDVKPEKD